MKTKILVTAIATVTACAGRNTWHAYQPVSGQSSSPKATIIQKATLAVVDAGWETEISDANTGLVVSKWLQGSGFAADDNRFRIRITVDDAGHYEVTAQCQYKDSGPLSGSAWVDKCDDSRRPQYVLDAVTKVEVGLK